MSFRYNCIIGSNKTRESNRSESYLSLRSERLYIAKEKYHRKLMFLVIKEIGLILTHLMERNFFHFCPNMQRLFQLYFV